MLFSYDALERAGPDAFEVLFPDWEALRFKYRVIHLNRLEWRDFLRHEKPVAIALMTKMKIASEDRPKVRAECLRLIARLKLDPARATVIGVFVGLMTSWELKGLEQGLERGLEQGLHDGKEEIIVRLIQKRFGSVSEDVAMRLDNLSSAHSSDLGEALFDFSELADLEQWLTRH